MKDGRYNKGEPESEWLNDIVFCQVDGDNNNFGWRWTEEKH